MLQCGEVKIFKFSFLRKHGALFTRHVLVLAEIVHCPAVHGSENRLCKWLPLWPLKFGNFSNAI